jgi:hypothetical protein
MCSRESCSVLPTRFLAGVFVFLSTFLIGVGLVQIYSLFVSNFDSSINPTQLDVVKEARFVEWNGPVARPDGIIQLDYLYTTPTVDGPDLEVEVKNNGTQTIYLISTTNERIDASGRIIVSTRLIDSAFPHGEALSAGTGLILTSPTQYMKSPTTFYLTYRVEGEKDSFHLSLPILKQHVRLN